MSATKLTVGCHECAWGKVAGCWRCGGRSGFRLVLPTKPLTITDAINRMALATGSARSAQAGSSADYNGHNLEVCWNDHRKYWVARYFWGGDYVISRGELEGCIKAARQFYDRQGRGASVRVEVFTEEDADLCESHGFIAADSEDKAWRDWRFEEINFAMDMERRGFGPYTSHLIAAESLADYKARCNIGHKRAPIASLVAKATGAAS